MATLTIPAVLANEIRMEKAKARAMSLGCKLVHVVLHGFMRDGELVMIAIAQEARDGACNNGIEVASFYNGKRL